MSRNWHDEVDAIALAGGEETAELRAAMEQDPSLREAIDAARAIYAALALVTHRLPPAALRARVMESVASTSRFERWASAAASVLRTTVENARALLQRIDAAASWEPAPMPGITLFHLEPYVTLPNAIPGFVKVAQGHQFPPHHHLGAETTLILQGTCRDDDGRILRPGDLAHRDAQTDHAFEVLPGPDFIYLVVVFDGVVIGGVPMLPGDRRV